MFLNLKKHRKSKQFKKIYWNNKRPNQLDIKDYITKVESWITLFTLVYQTRHVTLSLYINIHVLVADIPKFPRDIGNLNKFSQQGLKKLNVDITKAYFKSTNHHSEDVLTQILSKLNCME